MPNAAPLGTTAGVDGANTRPGAGCRHVGPAGKKSVPLQRQLVQKLILYLPWLATAAAMFACFSALAALHERFDYDVYVIDMPVPVLVALLVAAGVIFLVLPRLLRSAERNTGIKPVYLLTWIVLAGLAMRVVFFGTQPILEDDYNRYLLDGAVTANGLSPYEHSPEAIFDGATGNATLDRLATEAGAILERINYPGLTTVYPPVTQAAFALAHWLAPWSLDAWRILLLACDLIICGLIVCLLQTIGRSPIWVALYWWNPVVIKEFHNSAHMDLLVMLPVTAAVLLAIRARPVSSAAALAIGIGAKLWPVLLFPTLLRPWLSAPRTIILAAAVTGLLAAALLAPVILAGLDQTSGFVAYGSRWQANDALFRFFEWIVLGVTGFLGADPSVGKLVARAIVGAGLCAIVLYINRTETRSPREICYRAFVTIGALLLMSPTQFPWYYGWLAILLPMFPMRGFVILAATLPLYYVYFYLAARDMTDIFRYGVVLAIWLPAWVLLIIDCINDRNGLSTHNRDRLPENPVPGGPE